MLSIVFTSDYEIHGNGDGCPYELMVEPTERMLKQFEEYGAKLTIMADIAEILKFKEHAEQHGRDDFHYQRIADQLRDAIRRGHDVQLHIHASYFNARFEGGRWEQDWSEYNFAGLPAARIKEVVRIGKEYLESLLQPVDRNYRCDVFRAANWAVSPSRNVVRALVENDIRIDTSVFKYGRRAGIVSFDYTHAHSELLPWLVDEDDICRRNKSGKLIEVPIYCERRWIGAFLTRNRVQRAMMSRAHKLTNAKAGTSGPRYGASRGGLLRKLPALAKRHAWKADFNQCTGRQLIGALNRAAAAHDRNGECLPFVLIGHSKLYSPHNESSLRPFLHYVTSNPERFRHSTFRSMGSAPA